MLYCAICIEITCYSAETSLMFAACPPRSIQVDGGYCAYYPFPADHARLPGEEMFFNEANEYCGERFDWAGGARLASPDTEDQRQLIAAMMEAVG